MMRKLFFVLPLALALSQGRAAEASASPVLQQAYERLLSVQTFALWDIAFWHVDCAGTVSSGEQCFRTLTESTNGLPLFKAALTNGTPAARLYALCGIRRLAPGEFDALAAPIACTNSRIGVRVGSIGMVMMSSNIVAQIRKGAFDDFNSPP